MTLTEKIVSESPDMGVMLTLVTTGAVMSVVGTGVGGGVGTGVGVGPGVAVGTGVGVGTGPA